MAAFDDAFSDEVPVADFSAASFGVWHDSAAAAASDSLESGTSARVDVRPPTKHADPPPLTTIRRRVRPVESEPRVAPPPTLSWGRAARRRYERAWLRARTWTSRADWYEWYEVRRARLADSRYVARIVDAYERRGDALRLVAIVWSCVSVASSVYWLVGSSAAGDASYFDDPALVAFARAGQADVDFSRASVALECAEIRDVTFRRHEGVAMSFERARSYATYVLTRGDAAPSCVCAPMFGVRRRYLAVRFPNGTVAHLYNARDASPPDATTYSLVTENQRMLFPARSGSVQNVRRDTADIAFSTSLCGDGVMRVHDSLAWCSLACLDLMDGVTVYERAALTFGDDDESREPVRE